MKKNYSAVLSLLLCLIIIFVSLPVSAADTNQSSAKLYGHREIDYTAPVVHTPKNNKGDSAVLSSYDLRDDITLPPVRNQNPYGACWAHATMAALEIAMIKNGLADETVDLSELQLINSSYSDSKDPLGNLDGDGTVAVADHPLDLGGNFLSAAKVLDRWNAGAEESVMKYSEDDAFVREGGSFTDDFCFGLNNIRLSEFYSVNKENRDDIKRMIKKYGCAVTSYFHDENYINSKNAAIYSNVYSSTNHEIAIIGWDDNYSKDNFLSKCRPSSDGAWLIRNSWGETGAGKGYYWISYEDTSLEDTLGFFNVTSSDAYDRNYQYDGSLSITRVASPNGAANLYTAASHEYLKAINITFDSNTNVTYEVKVYKNPSSDKYFLKNDVPVYSGTYSTTFAGIYTAELSTPVELNEGDSFIVYYKIISCDEGTGFYNCAISHSWGWLDNNESLSGRSYVVYTNGSASVYQADFRIKAFTSLADIETPDNFTVSRNGNTVSLSWSAVEGADGYEIYSSVDNKAYAPALSVTGTSATLTASASDGILHKYKVRAVKGEEKGEFSQGRAVRFERNVRVASLSGENETVVVGAEINLSAVITPENASDKMISYKLISGDEYVSLTNDGILTAKKTGEAVVSAMTRDGAHSVDFNVTVLGETEHEPASPVIENAVGSTCTVKGSYDSVIYCKNCGEEISRETIETDFALHTPVLSKAEVSATCVKAGSTAEYKCSVCQTVTTASEVIPATGVHTPSASVRENNIPATCSKGGSYDTVIYCSVCGEEMSREKTNVPATGNHTAGGTVRENEKASTCTVKGSYDEVKYCSVCKTEMSRRTVTLELKAHSYNVVSTTPATCETEGAQIKVCSVCGDTSVTTVAKTAHKDSDGDLRCDFCGVSTAKPCNHSCHKSGFAGFFWKIMNFFNKLFKTNQFCECGAKHW